MKFVMREIRVLETALSNYKVLWSERDRSKDSPTDSVYTDMNILELESIIQRIKDEPRQ